MPAIHRGFALLIVGMLLGGPGAPVAAKDTTDAITAARQKINLSGRQRMLSQRLASSVCLVITGADTAKRTDVALAAWKDFDTALIGLKDGNDGLGLTHEPNQKIRDGLTTVEGTWSTFAPAVQQILAGDMNASMLGVIIDSNLTLLSQSNDVVKLFETTYGEGVIDPGTAVTINVAGRQRMLSQKMTKELCFIAADFDRAVNLDAIQATIALFDASLEHLRFGDIAANIVPPPNTDLAVQLGVVAEIWGRVKPGMDAVAAGGAVDVAELAEIAATTDTLLKEMNKAVLLYVSSNS